MRWIPLLIVIYVVVLVQTTIARVLTLAVPWVGPVSPNLLAIVTLFLALHAVSGADAMLVGWMLGLAVDLTSAGGPASTTVVGPMAVVYAVAAGGLFHAREALFHEHALTQALLAAAFCVFTDTLWLVTQSLLDFSEVIWSSYFHMLVQVLLSALFTAAITPLVYYILARANRWLLVVPMARRSRVMTRRIRR